MPWTCEPRSHGTVVPISLFSSVRETRRPGVPAIRAQGSTGPQAPFRRMHHGGRPANGPTTVRALTRQSKRPNRLSLAIRRRGSRPIDQVASGQHHYRVISEHGTTAVKRLEPGAGGVKAQLAGPHCGRIEGRGGGGRQSLELSGPRRSHACQP